MGGFLTLNLGGNAPVHAKKDENYEDFIVRCSFNPTGRFVKIRDLEDNLNVTRLQKIDSAAADRINRYLKALRFLKGME